jgi:hypothetical protein
VGGPGCSSLALIAAYCNALKKVSANKNAGLITQNELLTTLPQLLDDHAMRLVYLKVWAAQYYSKIDHHSSRIFGDRGVFLNSLATMGRALCVDMWYIYQCGATVDSSSGLYEHAYVGKYNGVAEGDKETFAQFNVRVQKIMDEYKALILARARVRRAEEGWSLESNHSWVDEVVLPRGAIEETDSRPPHSKHQFHAPFSTNEVRFGVGLKKHGSGYVGNLRFNP